MAKTTFALLVVMTVLACGPAQTPEPAGSAPVVNNLNPEVIAQITGRTPTNQGNEYKITLPHHELAVEVDGFRIAPPMGLTSWAAFTPAPEGAIVMGDLVLRESEIGSVQRTLLESGLTISALHNHFVRDRPKIMFMHIHGRGALADLARGVGATLARLSELRSNFVAAEPTAVENTLDSAIMDSRLGQSGTMNQGVYKLTVARSGVNLMDHGQSVSSFMGFNTWMAFQGTPERAAVSGDFAMLAGEVPRVIKALADSQIEVVAVHNHMIQEEPRIFFLHFWGVGPLEGLLTGLRAGLDETP